MTSAEVEAIINNTDCTFLLLYGGNLYEYIGNENGRMIFSDVNDGYAVRLDYNELLNDTAGQYSLYIKEFKDIFLSEYDGMPDKAIFRIGDMSVQVCCNANSVTVACYPTSQWVSPETHRVTHSFYADREWSDNYPEIAGKVNNYIISNGIKGKILNQDAFDEMCKWVDEQLNESLVNKVKEISRNEPQKQHGKGNEYETV